MKVVFITDLGDKSGVSTSLDDFKQKAMEEVTVACRNIGVYLTVILLDGGPPSDTEISNQVSTSDALIVDMTIQMQQISLLYLLGLRESYKLYDNIVLTHFMSVEWIEELRRILSDKVKLVPYLMDEKGVVYALEDRHLTDAITDNDVLRNEVCGHLDLLSTKLQQTLSEIAGRERSTLKEKFITDLRRIRDTYDENELRQCLSNFREQLFNQSLFSDDVVLNMLLSYRQAGDYEPMINLVEDIQKLELNNILDASMIQYLYAFALNRRNKSGDRDKALAVIQRLSEVYDRPSADVFGLLGRIYKDMFIESGYKNQMALECAIDGYRKGLLVCPKELYLLVNVASLLVSSGNEVTTCPELRQICKDLNYGLGRKGLITEIKDYWDVATFFEVRVITEDYAGAVEAVKLMYLLNPPEWQIASTITNIKLICRKRKPPPENIKIPEAQRLFNFWMEFLSDVRNKKDLELIEATSSPTSKTDHDTGYVDTPTAIRTAFPVLISETDGDFDLAYLQVNIDADPKNIRLCFYSKTVDPADMSASVTKSDTTETPLNKLMFGELNSPYKDIIFEAGDVKRIICSKKDRRSVYFYTFLCSRDYKIWFSCELTKDIFCSVVREYSVSDYNNVGFPLDDQPHETLEFEYELDEDGHPIKLGEGSFGAVYSGIEKTKGIKIAIKEMKSTDPETLEPLAEEIRLHSSLSHRNIVKYLGCDDSGGKFRIIMEHVPGCSLSSLLRKYGKLDEATVADYSWQILQGLNYLHGNRIVHRDIKGGNVLVDIYRGELKIADFNVSKRLVGLDPKAQTLNGTYRYLAPERIYGAYYGYPADIWSFGCTVIEMITGRKPFCEYEESCAALYDIGRKMIGHPRIPSDVSDVCRAFVERTFIHNPDERPSAAQLLMDVFFSRHGLPPQKRQNPASYGPSSLSRPVRAGLTPDIYQRFSSQQPNDRSPIFLSQSNIKVPTSAVEKNAFVLTCDTPVHHSTTGTSTDDVLLRSHDLESRSTQSLDELSPNSNGRFVKSPNLGNRLARTQANDNAQLSRLTLPNRSVDLINTKPDATVSPVPILTSPKQRRFNVSPGTNRVNQLRSPPPTNLTSSIQWNAAEYIQQENQKARILIVDALILEKDRIVKECRNIMSGFDMKLPLPPLSGFAPTTINRSTITIEHSSPNRDKIEMDLLECLLDMLVVHFREGTSWSQLFGYLTTPTNNYCTNKILSDQKSASTSDSFDFEHFNLNKLGPETRFVALIDKLGYSCGPTSSQTHIRIGSPLLCQFLKLALSSFSSAVQVPLREHVNRPHELLIWLTLIQDAVKSATYELDPFTKESNLKLRRHKTIGGGARSGLGTTSDSPATTRRMASFHNHPVTFAFPPALIRPMERASNFEGVHQNDSFKRSNHIQGANDVHELLTAETSVDLRHHHSKITSDGTTLRMKPRYQKNSLSYDSSVDEAAMSIYHGKRVKAFSTGFDSLDSWFKSLNIPSSDREKLSDNYINDEHEFLTYVTRRDLQKMKLSIGTVLRIWRHVTEIRNSHLNNL